LILDPKPETRNHFCEQGSQNQLKGKSAYFQLRPLDIHRLGKPITQEDGTETAATCFMANILKIGKDFWEEKIVR